MKTYDELREAAKVREVEAAVDRLNEAYALLDNARDGGTEDEIFQAQWYWDMVYDERMRLKKVYGF
jgi:hypothetical protein